jgi:hypothetical protein
MRRSDPGTLTGSLLLVAAAGVLLSCASQADLDEIYTRGIKAAREDRWKDAMSDLETFTANACAKARPAPHCRDALLTLGRGHERRGAPAAAWVAFDAALLLPPHARDAAVREDLERAERELGDKHIAGERGPVIVRYRDEVTDEYTPRSVAISIDLSPVFTKDKGASELRGPDFTQVWGGSVPAGAHVLVVEALHGCKPGEGARCSSSRARRAWAFDSLARAPVTLDVRAFAEAGEGDAPARPMLDLRRR